MPNVNVTTRTLYQKLADRLGYSLSKEIKIQQRHSLPRSAVAKAARREWPRQRRLKLFCPPLTAQPWARLSTACLLMQGPDGDVAGRPPHSPGIRPPSSAPLSCCRGREGGRGGRGRPAIWLSEHGLARRDMTKGESAGHSPAREKLAYMLTETQPKTSNYADGNANTRPQVQA